MNMLHGLAIREKLISGWHVMTGDLAMKGNHKILGWA